MLDSLLYEPRRRRVAMGTLAVVLVLAVGFIAFGALMPTAAVLLVFGASFFAAALFLIGKLLVVSHVHIRGTAARLEALNDRYDDTARWLERFDKDTRESFLVAKQRLAAADKGNTQLAEALAKLGEETPRLAAFEKLSGDTPRLKDLAELQESVVAKHAALEASIESAKAAQTSAKGELERLFKASEQKLAADIEKVRSDLPDVAPLADRIGELEAELTSLQSSIEAASSRATELAEATKAASAGDLTAAKGELSDRLRVLDDRVTKLDGEHDRKRQSAVTAAKQEASESAAKLSRRVDETARLSGRLRGDGYVQFPRVLSGEAIEAASAFGAKVMPAHLKYLERKLQVIEGLCEGRLAGSVDDAVGRALAGYLVKAKELRVLEIGVLFGVGAAFMHHALSPRHERVVLTLLDPFQGYYGNDHLDPLTGLPVTRAAVERNMARCGIDAGDVEILEGFSHEEAIRESAEQKGPYHIIVIDGDHTSEGVRADFEGYADMLRSGGLLVIDDYGSDDWPAVTAFVDEIVRTDPRFKSLVVIGKTAVFKRSRSGGPKKQARSQANPQAKSRAAVEPQGPEGGAATKEDTDARVDGAATASKRGASGAESVDASESPAPIVQTPSRTKKGSAKKAAKKSAKRSAVAAGDESGDAGS